jgi:hypothetical protein
LNRVAKAKLKSLEIGSISYEELKAFLLLVAYQGFRAGMLGLLANPNHL